MCHGREYLCWHTSVTPRFSQSSASIQDSPPELVDRRRHTMNGRSNERQDSANDQKPPKKATFFTVDLLFVDKLPDATYYSPASTYLVD